MNTESRRSASVGSPRSVLDENSGRRMDTCRGNCQGCSDKTLFLGVMRRAGVDPPSNGVAREGRDSLPPFLRFLGDFPRPTQRFKQFLAKTRIRL